MGPVQQAMSDAKLTANDIDEVILVGGSTRIPRCRTWSAGSPAARTRT